MSIDGRAVGEAVADRLPRALVREDPAAGDWALRTLLAGRHAAPVRVEVQTDSGLQSVAFLPGQSNRPKSALTTRFIDPGIRVVRLHNSLGHAALVPAWDAALNTLRETDGLVLDLRDTPGGGNTTVARGLLGPLVSELRPLTSAMIFPARSVATASLGSGSNMSRPAAPIPTTSRSPFWSVAGSQAWARAWRSAWTAWGAQPFSVPSWQGCEARPTATRLSTRGSRCVGPEERLFHVDGTRRDAFVPRMPTESGSSGEDFGLADRPAGPAPTSRSQCGDEPERSDC